MCYLDLMNDQKKKDVGAIWVKSGQYGDYLSIQVEINGQKHNLVAYPNKYKEAGDKKPDYRIPEPKQNPTANEKPNAYRQTASSINNTDDMPF